MEEIRSFIAIELPDELKKELARMVARFETRQPSVKWVAPSSIHLTLKFLGNVPGGRIEEITRAMLEATGGIPPFSLEAKGLGVFPNLQRVQVAWMGISGEVDKLAQLQGRLESNLARLGFPTEARAFTPHLTLGRVRNQASPEERRELGQLIAGTKFTAVKFEVDAISLMRSQLTRQGAIYSRISVAILGKIAS